MLVLCCALPRGLGVAIGVFDRLPRPIPTRDGDTRLPNIATKLHQQIRKTALDAEELVAWEHADDVFKVVEKLKTEGFSIAAIEQTPAASGCQDFSPAG